MATTRITGKQGLVFKLETVDYASDVTTVTLSNEDADADVTTFADAAAGGTKQWFFEGTALAGTDTTGALWRYLWANTGDNNVAFVYAPYGNATPTADKPHFTGTCTIGAKPEIGGEAGSTWTFDFRIDVNAEPTLVSA